MALLDGGRTKKAHWKGGRRRATLGPVAVPPQAEPDFTQFTPHPRFDEAVAALDAGDLARLGQLLDAEPALVHARTNLDRRYGYFAGATLLHHIAGNPNRGPLPPNIVDVARLLVDRGADVHASTPGPNGGTTMGLVVTSKRASGSNASGPIIDLLLQRGAALDLDDLDSPLANHAPRAA